MYILVYLIGWKEITLIYNFIDIFSQLIVTIMYSKSTVVHCEAM